MTVGTTGAEPYVLKHSDRLTGISGPADVRFLATAAETGGSFTVMDYTAPPGFPGPPLHRHLHEDEAYYVIDGILTIQSGDERQKVGPGGFMWAPRGYVHGFANLSAAEVRFLGFIVPGGLEGMFREIADHIAETGGNVVEDELVRINEQYLEVVGPPIGADQG